MIGPFIMLDCDGVLNSHKAHKNGYCGLEIENVDLMNYILETTGANIVLSSAWRYFVLRNEMTLQGLNGLFSTHGLKWNSICSILGPDIRLNSGETDRGLAIKNWFKTQYGLKDNCRYIAIDDMDLGYTRHEIPFVKTDSDKGLVGLSNSKLKQIINLLNGHKVDLSSNEKDYSDS